MGKLFFTTPAKPFMGKIHDAHGNYNVPWVMNWEFFPLQIPKMIGSTFLLKKLHFRLLYIVADQPKCPILVQNLTTGGKWSHYLKSKQSKLYIALRVWFWSAQHDEFKEPLQRYICCTFDTMTTPATCWKKVCVSVHYSSFSFL